jgi:hypothetical protein
MPLAQPTVSPKLLASIARYYPHTVTVQRLTAGARDEYGASAENWADLAGHSDIKARVVSNGPGTGAGGWSGEVWAPNGQYDVDGRTMSLHGYYPQITEKDRVIWDGLTYDIQAVESDAEGVTTRLRAKKVR